MMKKYFIWMPVLLMLVIACKSRKTSLADEEEVQVADFIEFFPETKPPVVIGDTTLQKKPNDSMLIGYKVFTRFIPDSVLKKDFGAVKPALYAVAKVKEKGQETYLFIKAIQGNKRVAYLACFDKKDQYLKAMPLVKTGFASYSSTYGSLDNKFQITTYYDKKTRSGDLTYKKNVYFYNSGANDFTLILTEPNEDIIEEIINPIDTISRKHKFAGDYVQNKKNFISVRDGKNPSEILIFIHFEKGKEECSGELKGRARFIKPTVAQYYESGNPCTIELAFSGNRVNIKETGGCGTYRDIKCFFEGSFWKKETKKATK